MEMLSSWSERWVPPELLCLGFCQVPWKYHQPGTDCALIASRGGVYEQCLQDKLKPQNQAQHRLVTTITQRGCQFSQSPSGSWHSSLLYPISWKWIIFIVYSLFKVQPFEGLSFRQLPTLHPKHHFLSLEGIKPNPSAGECLPSPCNTAAAVPIHTLATWLPVPFHLQGMSLPLSLYLIKCL